MTTDTANKVVVTAAVLTFIISSANTIIKRKELPSRQFIIGSGIVFLGLSALANFLPDLAVPIAIAVFTTVFLGQGGGVLSYFTPKGELDTEKKAPRQTSQEPATTRPGVRPVVFPTNTVIPGLIPGGQDFPPVTEEPVPDVNPFG